MNIIRTQSPDPASFAWAIRNDLTDLDTTLDVAKDQLFTVNSSGEIIAIVEPGQFVLKDVLAAVNQSKPSQLSLYCFASKIFGQLGWGTATPIQLRDNQGKQLLIKGHGTFGFALWNPKSIWRAFGGVGERLAAADLQTRCREIILSTLQQELQTGLSDGSIQEKNITAIPAVSRKKIEDKIRAGMRPLGLDLSRFEIINLSVE